jgi:hypothetical protein
VDSIFLWLWLSQLLLLRLSRLLLLQLNRLLLLRLTRLRLLAQGVVGCQLPDGDMTCSALVTGTVDVNLPKFRDRRV